MSERPAARAFTLVEVLVVAAVIALLVSILLPSLARARQQAKEVTCMCHLRQLHAGVSGYAQDHKGVIPPFRAHGRPCKVDPSPGNIGWAQAVDRYIPTECVRGEIGAEEYGDVHRCPLKRENAVEGDPDCPIKGSYGLNAYLSTFTSWIANKPKVVFDWQRLDSVKHSAQVVLIGESCRMVTVPALPPALRGLVPRHRDYHSSNIAWIDGHVTSEQSEPMVDLKQRWDLDWTEGKTYADGLPTN